MGRVEPGDGRVQAAARDDQQREAGAPLLIVNANRTSFIERHGFLPMVLRTANRATPRRRAQLRGRSTATDVCNCTDHVFLERFHCRPEAVAVVNCHAMKSGWGIADLHRDFEALSLRHRRGARQDHVGRDHGGSQGTDRRATSLCSPSWSTSPERRPTSRPATCAGSRRCCARSARSSAARSPSWSRPERADFARVFAVSQNERPVRLFTSIHQARDWLARGAHIDGEQVPPPPAPQRRHAVVRSRSREAVLIRRRQRRALGRCRPRRPADRPGSWRGAPTSSRRVMMLPVWVLMSELEFAPKEHRASSARLPAGVMCAPPRRLRS